jgi:hypothetical protein
MRSGRRRRLISWTILFCAATIPRMSATSSSVSRAAVRASSKSARSNHQCVEVGFGAVGDGLRDLVVDEGAHVRSFVSVREPAPRPWTCV